LEASSCFSHHSVDWSWPDLEFPVKVGQLIDGIGAADLFVGRFPEHGNRSSSN